MFISAHEFISHLPEKSQPPEANPYIPQLLSGAIFCGHLVGLFHPLIDVNFVINKQD